MSSLEERIITYVEGTGSFPETSREIAEALDVPHSTITASLRRLESRGLVRKLGVSFSGAHTWGVAG